MKLTDKFIYIEINLFAGKLDFLINGILPPIGIALAFIYIYPIPAKIIYKHYRKRQNELLAIKKETDESKPISEKEARNLKRDLFKIEQEFEKEVIFKENQIKELKAILNDAEKEISKLKLIDNTKLGINKNTDSALSFEELKANEIMFEEFEIVLDLYDDKDTVALDEFDTHVKRFFSVNDIFEFDSNGNISMGNKGKQFRKIYAEKYVPED